MISIYLMQPEQSLQLPTPKRSTTTTRRTSYLREICCYLSLNIPIRFAASRPDAVVMKEYSYGLVMPNSPCVILCCTDENDTAPNMSSSFENDDVNKSTASRFVPPRTKHDMLLVVAFMCSLVVAGATIKGATLNRYEFDWTIEAPSFYLSTTKEEMDDASSPVPEKRMIFTTAMLGDNARETISSSNSTTDSNHGIAVFYNVYMAANQTTNTTTAEDAQLQKSAYDVIQEQIHQITASVQSSSLLEINIVNIGAKLDPQRITEICATAAAVTHNARHDDLKCRILRYNETGWEDLTMTELYNYCQGRPQDKVIYMHNKGSFHPKLQVGRRPVVLVCTSTVFLHATQLIQI